MSKVITTTKGGMLAAEVCNNQTQVQIVFVPEDDTETRIILYFSSAKIKQFLTSLAKELR